MDFLDPKKKRNHGIKLFVGYALVAVAIGLAALILIFLAYGYGLDKSGSVIQNGIVFVDSNPSNAEIYVNGDRFKSNTDARLVLPSDDYKLEIKKDGYRTWQRRFFLGGGELQRFVYPLLFPIDLKTSDVETFKTTPALASQSPDRRWLVVQKEKASRVFDIYDLSAGAPVAESRRIPNDMLTGKTKSFKVIEWSTDNRRVLLKHTHQKGTEFIVFDREQPDESININSLTKGNFMSVRLRDKKFDRWYLHNTNNKRLFTANRSNPTPERVLNGVITFTTHGNDMVLYATNRNAKPDQTNIKVLEGERDNKLREVARSGRYLLDVAQFDGAWYFVAGASKNGKVYVYKDPFDAIRSTPRQEPVHATIMRLEKPEYVSFSQNARFIVVQAGDSFALYDAEEESAYRYTTGLNIPRTEQARWMDGHRLSVVLGGRIVVFDYDGTNVQQLTRSGEAFGPYFGSNYEQLYSLAPKEGSKEANLTRTNLLVE